MSSGPTNGSPAAKLVTYLPPSGVIVKDLEPLSLVLCKPKLLPIKSLTLEQLQVIESKFHKGAVQ